MRHRRATLLAFALGLHTAAAVAEPAVDAAALYQTHCAACHGADRLGARGPALLPDNLQRLKKADAETVIRDGRIATQMPAFGAQLTAADITALTALVYAPLAALPPWGAAEIAASRTVFAPAAALPDRPVHDADPLNLFTVVETGDHHVTILDGDRFVPLWRFPSRYALHGGAKYSPDGRFVFLGSRDGWVGKYDLWGLTAVAEVRAGINLRNIAVSADGRWVIVGNYLPHSVVILDARDLSVTKIIAAADVKGRGARVSAVYTAPPRQSFIVALKDVAEMWEISYAAAPPPVATGFVHSHQPGMLEGAFDRGPFPVRRIALDQILDDFFFDPPYRHAIGGARDAAKGQVINLNVGRRIAEIDLPGMPHLASGITFDFEGRPVLATPILGQGAIAVVDMEHWQTIRRIATPGPGFFLRSHDNTPYAWADVFFGKDRDAMLVIDKRTLSIAATLRPQPGKTAAHVEFTRDGRFALVSIWEDDGALVVYDAATFAEVKRLPMRKPAGKYNVYNKITYAAGTSH